MILSADVSRHIVATAHTYIGKPYDFKMFDCVHFIMSVYREVGIEIPRFGGSGFPPPDLNLSALEFEQMPLGQTVFFKRRTSPSSRIWTHMAIIASPSELIHCSRHFGNKVTITAKPEFMEIYAHAMNTEPQP